MEMDIILLKSEGLLVLVYKEGRVFCGMGPARYTANSKKVVLLKSKIQITKYKIHEKVCNRSKFECLLFEMLFIRDIRPSMNKQSDSIRAKLFT